MSPRGGGGSGGGGGGRGGGRGRGSSSGSGSKGSGSKSDTVGSVAVAAGAENAASSVTVLGALLALIIIPIAIYICQELDLGSVLGWTGVGLKRVIVSAVRKNARVAESVETQMRERRSISQALEEPQS